MPDKKFTATLRNITTGEKRDQEFDAVDMLEAGGIADGFIRSGEELIRIELIDPVTENPVTDHL